MLDNVQQQRVMLATTRFPRYTAAPRARLSTNYAPVLNSWF